MTIRSKLTLLLAALVAAGVLGYNFWSYSCGHCTLRSMMTLGPAGYLLLGANLILGGLLAVSRQRQSRRLRRQQCRCGCLLMPAWQHCPACGEKSCA